MSKPQPFHSFKLFADEEDFAEIGKACTFTKTYQKYALKNSSNN